MSKDDSMQNDEAVSEINTAPEEIAPKKKAVRKKTAAKKEPVNDLAANESLNTGENGRFEFSPDDEVEEKKNKKFFRRKGEPYRGA